MPLTRHLYEIDEVVSALQIGLRKEEGLFWLWELVVSGETELAKQTLIDLWTLNCGGYDSALLLLDPPSVESYCRICTANPLQTVVDLLRLTATMPSRPSLTPLPASPAAADRRKTRSAAFVASITAATDLTDSELADFWISFDSACRQGSTVDAIWLLQAAQHLSEETLWSAIEIAARGPATTKEIIAVLRTQKTQPSLLYLAAATMMLCIPSEKRSAPTAVDTSVAEGRWATWNSKIGRREARAYAIPADALHAGTTRGQMPFKYTNIGDVREPVGLLSEGCRFWQEALEKHGIVVDAETGATAFPSDDVLERFYECHFPDDIPDEWSKRDQEKSHGRGCQETATSPPTIIVREIPVERREWKFAITVRPDKKLKAA